MNSPHATAPRTALALVRLVELDDQQAARLLLGGLDAGTLREVLLAQTSNVGLLFEAVFAEVFEERLPAIAAEHGKTRGEVVADYLERLTLRFALAEGQPDR